MLSTESMMTRRPKMDWSSDSRLHRTKRHISVFDALVYFVAGTLLGMTIFGITPLEAWQIVTRWIGR
jgi:hypothetical protein